MDEFRLTPPPPGREQHVAIAKKASCDTRTVTSYLAGLSTRPLVRRRIEEALVSMNLGHLVQR